MHKKIHLEQYTASSFFKSVLNVSDIISANYFHAKIKINFSLRGPPII